MNIGKVSNISKYAHVDRDINNVYETIYSCKFSTSRACLKGFYTRFTSLPR